jgi:hypothetical protein
MPYVATRDGRRQRSAGNRAPAVPHRLDDLHGHSVGTIELPHHMATGHRSRRRFDLADPAQQRQAYQAVLCQAADCCEVNDLLNPGVLRRIWGSLHLPGRIRAAWESRHPALTSRSGPVFATSAEIITSRTRRQPVAAVTATALTKAQMIVARTASAR